MPGFERDSTIDIIKRHIVDSAVQQAVVMFTEDLQCEAVRRRDVSRIAHAAAHAAVERFAGEIASQVALVTTYYELRLEMANMRPPSVDLSKFL